MLLNLKTFIGSINYFWLNLKLQTQIILATISLILLFLSSLTSWSSLNIQNSSQFNNPSFVTDISLLLRDELISLLEAGRSDEIIPFCEQFYKKRRSIRYILFIDTAGKEYGIPYTTSELINNSLLPQRKVLLKSFPIFFNRVVQFDPTPFTYFVLEKDQLFGFLIIGNTFNYTLFNNILITNKLLYLISLIFIVVIFFGALFIQVTITRPLGQVSTGLRIIASGTFTKRIELRFGGAVGDLIASFNELGRRLQLYEDKNRQQLLSERIKLESLITTITDGALLLDNNLRVLLVNPTAIKIFGWKTKTKLIGTPIWNNLPISLQKKFFVTLQDVLTDTQTAIFDAIIEDELAQFPNRSIRIILNIVYDSSDLNKIPIGIGVTIQDMTKAFELDKTQQRFMSNISHELRTPLFNIKSFIETIQEYEYTLSSWQKKYFLDIVINETNRLTRLVNDILCISKLDSLKDVPLGVINLVETINQTKANYQIVAHDNDLYLHTQMDNVSLNVQGNSDLLLQVLINLVGNALKFTYKDGEIIMRAYLMKNKRIRVEIIDTGVGILYAYQQSIFQRFYRIENEVHTLKGAGLGLSIVNSILDEHKSTVNLVSRYRVGSAFWFDLIAT